MSDRGTSAIDGDDLDEFDRRRRRVLWSIPNGLFVIGSHGTTPGGERWNLMTASLVVQVAVRPKLVAVAVDATSVTIGLIMAGDGFSISLLDRSDRALARKFVKPVEDVRFRSDGQPESMAGESVVVGQTGCPRLSRCVTWIDCRLSDRLELGSHVLCIGEVVDVGASPEPGATVLRMEDTRMNYGG